MCCLVLLSRVGVAVRGNDVLRNAALIVDLVTGSLGPLANLGVLTVRANSNRREFGCLILQSLFFGL